MGIFEILVDYDDNLRTMIHAGARAARLRAQARQEWHAHHAGGRGARKIIAGLTTVEEVASLTVGDAV
jgi:type IV pilus assembly protein PilB